MIILRNKNFALLEKKQYYKNNWDRLKHGWFGTSKESIDQYNKFVSKHNAEEKKLSGLLKNNPRQYLIELYNLDTVTNKLREFEKVFNTKLPQDIFKYVETIKSFAGPLKTWAAKYPNENPRLPRIDGIINSFNVDLELKSGKVENFRDDLEDTGDVCLLDVGYDDVIVYNIDKKVWNLDYTGEKDDTKTLKDTLLSTIKNTIDLDDGYVDGGYDGVDKRFPEFELRKLWYNHIKSTL